MAGEGTAGPGQAASPGSRTDDPILSAALSELESEGVRLDEPIGTEPETTEHTGEIPDGAPPPVEPPAPTREASPPAQAQQRSTPSTPSTPQRTPGSPAPVAEPQEPDPDHEYAQAPAFSFAVDGQPRTLDYIKTFAGEGALIREADLPKLQADLESGVRYAQHAQALAQRLQDTDRLTAWDVTQPDGTTTTITGPAAIRAAREAHGMVLARLSVFEKALTDPEVFRSLVAWDEANQVPTLNPVAARLLQYEARDLTFQIKEGIAAKFGPMHPASQGAQQAPIDPAAAAPAVVTHVASRLQVTNLTDADKQQLAAMVPNFVRAATQADVAAALKKGELMQVGEPVVDLRFNAQVKYLSDLRAESARQASATSAADKHNSAMQRARQPAKAPQGQQARTAPAAPPAPPPKVGKQEAWQKVLDDALLEINV